MAKLIIPPGAQPAEAGEAKVVDFLRNALPETYTLLPNLEIAERGRPPFEYDLIVAAPHAVYVVEIKNWRGGIRGDEGAWLVGGRHARPNPWPTANNKARVLKSRIQELQPSCRGVWVDAAIAIADDQGVLQLTGALNQRVFRYTDLPAYLTDPSLLPGGGADARPLRAYLEKAIQQASHARSPRTLAFGGYEAVETLLQSDAVAEYLARNTLLPNAPHVRVRVFPYDPYLPPDELKLREQMIRREAEALQHIDDSPYLIRVRHFSAVPDDPNLFYEVTEWSGEGTLAGMLTHTDALPLERKLELALGIAEGLRVVHAAGVVHRDLRPENVLIAGNGQPKLMNFDRARLPVGSGLTISPLPRDPSITRAYLAPELADSEGGVATAASDLYSLGAILFEMLAGDRLYDTPEDALRANTSAGGPSAFRAVPDVPPRLNALVASLMKPDPILRPTAEEVASELRAIVEQTRRPAPKSEPRPVTPTRSDSDDKAVFEVGDIVDGHYQVQAVMRPGGSGQVYKVYDSIFDQVFALKVFFPGFNALEFLTQEARALLRLEHPNTVRVRQWERLGGNRLYLVMDFVDGEELTEYTVGQKRLSVHEAVRLGVQLLSALEAIHGDSGRLAELRNAGRTLSEEEYFEIEELERSSYLHRDIKPANLILANGVLKVIDFNIATPASRAGITFTGTRGYMAPDIGLAPWDASCDVFAAGIVLYELITKQHPYPNREPKADLVPADPREHLPNLAPALTQVLLRAVTTDRAARYTSAREMRSALLALDDQLLVALPPATAHIAGITLTADEVGRANYNPFVTRLLSLYSQATENNRGTRGFDEVAQLTYVATLLDKHLLPDVLDGRYRLVVVTGNAGDGKTAFIHKVEQKAEDGGAIIEQVSANASRFRFNGHDFVTNYDGSQDEGAERANDQVLSEFFAAFVDGDVSPKTVHLIAINEGRLIDFFDGADHHRRFSQLSKTIRSFFADDQTHLPDWLLIVDLNQRSVIAQEMDQSTGQPATGSSIFEQQLEHLLKAEHWAPCSACTLADRCFIKFNVDTLANPVSGAVVRERLRTLFEIVHLRRKLHITMRDLRSALAWMIARDHDCGKVAALLGESAQAFAATPDQLVRLLYINAFAGDDALSAVSADDRLVALLRQIDVAEVANPGDDRALYFDGVAGCERLTFVTRTDLPERLLTIIRADLSDGWEGVQSASGVRKRQAYAGMLRRLAYFERRDDRWQEMLPYRHLAGFREILRDGHAEQQTRILLAQGLSTLEGAHSLELKRTHIFLRAGREQKVRVKSFRLFPIEEFSTLRPRARATSRRYLEYLPDRFQLVHTPPDGNHIKGVQPAELIVTLDVWELLARVSEGYLPSFYDLGGHYLNLVIFKNALTHLHYRRALLTRDDRTFFEVRQERHGRVSLRRYESGE
ncbi:MAG: protein kinase [Caldilineaceae bacterium]|nr:protein kinase [Caldilineaceae bacterium]